MNFEAGKSRKEIQTRVGQDVNLTFSNLEADDSRSMQVSVALPSKLMEEICDRTNLNAAYRRVKANKGVAGVDGMTIDELTRWLSTNKTSLIASLLDGSYHPAAVLKVEIPKPGGGKRMLGIPTVKDRLVQQAILQVLQGIFDKTFSPSSFGFRPGRSAHGALKMAQGYVKEGHRYVVDIDIEKFFDRVSHDILMSRLARRLGDKRLLRIIRRFLEAGIMSEGVVTSRHEGTPQGGPLSPLLSNVLLDDLDKELERRGLRFCRYADDCNIYVKSKAAAERVLGSVTVWLERKLKLKVNLSKSAAATSSRRSFLGYVVQSNRLLVSPESFARLKSKLRRCTRRRGATRFEDRIKAINDLTRGWVNYFGMASCRNRLIPLDEWLRHRLRCVKLQELKRTYPRVCFLISLDVKPALAWGSCRSGQGLWAMGRTAGANFGMSAKWFQGLGLISFSEVYARVHR